MGKWNLDLDGVDPVLSLHDPAGESVAVDLPRFDVGDAGTEQRRRSSVAACPCRRIGDRLVTTVFDLLLAQYGVGRDGLPGDWAAGYDDARAVHPGVAGGDHLRPGRDGRAHRTRVRGRTPRSPAAAR